MSKFKRGDKVKRVINKHSYELFCDNPDQVFTVALSEPEQGIRLYEDLSGYWFNSDYFELYQEPVQKTFNPKPGDTIVTEGEGNWVCVDKTDDRYYAYQDYDFIGVNNNGFTAWMVNGNAHRGYNPAPHIYDKFRIKEIIPASSNNPVVIPQENPDLSFQVKALELENQMLRMLLRREGVEV